MVSTTSRALCSNWAVEGRRDQTIRIIRLRAAHGSILSPCSNYSSSVEVKPNPSQSKLGSTVPYGQKLRHTQNTNAMPLLPLADSTALRRMSAVLSPSPSASRSSRARRCIRRSSSQCRQTPPLMRGPRLSGSVGGPFVAQAPGDGIAGHTTTSAKCMFTHFWPVL